MNQPQNLPSHQEIILSDVNDDGVDLFGLIQTLGEEKWLLFGLPFICSCIAAVISLYLTPMYTAKATFILPDKQSSSQSAVLDSLGSLGGMAGSISRAPIDMYVALMKSDVIQDKIVAELDLVQRYQTKNLEDASIKLASSVVISADKKSGVITILAKDQSPEFAANLANAYLKPFRVFLNRMSLDEAHQRRDFFAQQISVIAQRPFRDPSIQSALMNSVIRQYEAARIDEARESQILFPVDFAKTPEKRSSPNRAQLVLIVGAGTFFLTLLLIFIKRVLRKLKNDPALSPNWVMLRKAWQFRA